MKANLFALFCITLFVLSVPQAFAQGTETNVPANQTVEENPTENKVTEPVEAVEAVEPVEADSVQEEQSDVELVPKAEEPAAVESNATKEVAPEEPEAPATTDAQEKQETADKVEIVVPVNGTESGPQTAPVTTETALEAEQDSTEEVAADKSDEVVAAPSGEGNTTTTAAEPNETIETVGTTESPESTESPETTAAAPTETPGSTNATNATNAEPSAPVSSPEASQETAPAAESEEQLEKKDGLSLFGLISKVLVGLGILSVVILVGCVYHYRYQMQKYKIAPFTPPSFLPECLFPRNTESSGRLISGYTELQVGNYQSAPRFAEI